MLRTPAHPRRLPVAFAAPALAVGAVALAACMASCILGEPTADLPRLPPTPPVIVRGSVSPSANGILSTFPPNGVFVVPVALTDPTVTFQWAAFVDYDPTTNEGLQLTGDSTFEPDSLSTSTRVIEIPLTPPVIEGCHIVEVVVALQLRARDTANNAHTPLDPGGDSIQWIYSPSGDLAGCPVLDAGIDATLPEAAPPDTDGSVP